MNGDIIRIISYHNFTNRPLPQVFILVCLVPLMSNLEVCVPYVPLLRHTSGAQPPLGLFLICYLADCLLLCPFVVFSPTHTFTPLPLPFFLNFHLHFVGFRIPLSKPHS